MSLGDPRLVGIKLTTNKDKRRIRTIRGHKIAQRRQLVLAIVIIGHIQCKEFGFDPVGLPKPGARGTEFGQMDAIRNDRNPLRANPAGHKIVKKAPTIRLGSQKNHSIK